jgi:hypothetical protein
MSKFLKRTDLFYSQLAPSGIIHLDVALNGSLADGALRFDANSTVPA